jgi:hypothetical protein
MFDACASKEETKGNIKKLDNVTHIISSFLQIIIIIIITFLFFFFFGVYRTGCLASFDSE